MKKLSFRRPSILLGSGRGRLIVFLFVILVALVTFQFLAPDAFTAVASPLFAVGRSGAATVGGLFDSFAASRQLVKDIQELKAENAELLTTNDMLAARISDIEKLTSFAFGHRQLVLAGVLAGPPVTPYDVLVVEGGTKDGIKEGARVFGPGGVPLGTVARANTGTSRVILFSSSGHESYGWIGEARTALTLLGRGAGAFDATLPKDMSVSIGDPVYIPGPGAVPIGSIGRVSEFPSSPEKTIHITPAVNIFSLTWVLIEAGSESL